MRRSLLALDEARPCAPVTELPVLVTEPPLGEGAECCDVMDREGDGNGAPDDGADAPGCAAVGAEWGMARRNAPPWRG